MNSSKWLAVGVRLVVVAVAMIAFFSTCKKQDERSGIVGSVTIPGGSKDGVTVSLYDMPSFDAASVWTNTRLQHSIGFEYPPQAAFEPRSSRAVPRATVTTGSDGSFNFPGLDNGPYLVVASKDSFGWTFPQRANLSGSKLDVGSFTLNRENYITANSTLHTSATWLAGQHYVVLGNFTIAAGETLTVEPGAVVRIEEDARILVYGALLCEGTPEQFILFTSNMRLPSAQDWRYINFQPGAAPPLFRYCAFRFGDQAVISETPGGRIENCLFTDLGVQGIDLSGSAESTDSIVVRHCVFDHLQTGVRVDNVLTPLMSLDHNAIFGCSNYGMRLDNPIRGGVVYCNYFYNNGREDTVAGHETGAIFVSGTRNVEISYNELNSCWWGMTIGSGTDSTTYVHHNRFTRNTICVNIIQVLIPGLGPTYPVLNSNTMQSCSRYFQFNSCGYNTHDIQADGNYFNGQDGAALEGRMVDCHDNNGQGPPCPCFLHSTVMSSPVTGAGLCTN